MPLLPPRAVPAKPRFPKDNDAFCAKVSAKVQNAITGRDDAVPWDEMTEKGKDSYRITVSVVFALLQEQSAPPEQ